MHAAKLSHALMTLLSLLARQLGLSLLSGKPGADHINDRSHAELTLLRCLQRGASSQALCSVLRSLFLSHCSSALQQLHHQECNCLTEST